MKKALLVIAAVAMGASAFAQGTIVFANRNIPIAAGGTTGGGNGNGTYNVPIWKAEGTGPGNGAGSLAGGVTVGLYDPTGNTLLGSTLLRNDANSQFFATAAQTLTVPNNDAGTTPTLIVRSWQTSAGSFANAKAGQGEFGEWSFTTKPLGGTPASGGLPITPPNMTGWGPESGAGLQLSPVPEPTTVAFGVLGLGALVLARRRK